MPAQTEPVVEVEQEIRHPFQQAVVVLVDTVK
jgi:hypothetical protein